MSRDLKNSELIRRAIDGRLLDVRTSVAAEVVEFFPPDRATIRVGVRVQVVDSDSDPEVSQLEDLQDVPVMFPNFGDFVMYFPLAPGAPGRLEYSEEDDSLFYETSDETPINPLILERHKSWCVFRPEGSRAGTLIGSEPSTRAYIGKPGGVGISMGDEVKIGGSDASEPAVMEGPLTDAMGTLLDTLSQAFTAVGASSSANGALGAEVVDALAITPWLSGLGASKVIIK